jgi:hypothetical protein
LFEYSVSVVKSPPTATRTQVLLDSRLLISMLDATPAHGIVCYPNLSSEHRDSQNCDIMEALGMTKHIQHSPLCEST